MTDREAEEALRQKRLVVASDGDGPNWEVNWLAGRRERFGLVLTGHLVEKRKQGKNLVFVFETNHGEEIGEPSSRFKLSSYQPVLP